VPLLVLVIVLFSMAGIFYTISGAVNACAKQERAMGLGGGARETALQGLYQGLILLFFHLIQRTFFLNGFVAAPNGGEPKFPIGQINGWLRNGQPVAFRWAQWTQPGTLSTVGLSVIILSLAFFVLFRNGGAQRLKRNAAVLMVFGILVLAMYPAIDPWVTPLYQTAYQRGQYLLAFGLGQLCLEFGLLPNLAYLFFGAAIGLWLTARQPQTEVNRVIDRMLLAFAALSLLGLPLLLMAGEVKRSSAITGGLAACVGVVVFVGFLKRSLRLWEFSPDPIRTKRLLRWAWLRRLGRLSLTVYVLEPLVGELVNLGLIALWGPLWCQSPFAVLGMGVFCLAAWALIAWAWQRIGFVFSLEWTSARLLEALTGQPSSRADFREP